MSRTQIAVSIQRFFLAFDKAYGQTSKNVYPEDAEHKNAVSTRNHFSTRFVTSRQIYVEGPKLIFINDSAAPDESSDSAVLLDGNSQDWAVIGTSPRVHEVSRSFGDGIADSVSPPVVGSHGLIDSQSNKVNY